MIVGYKSWYKYMHGIIGEYNRHTGNTTENSGVAAEAAELRDWMVLVAFHSSCWCFPIQGLVYSLFSLFEDQVLKLSGVSSVVLSCSGLGLLTLLSSDDQVLKILLMVAVLSDLGLSLLSLLLRTKYQISHTVERLVPGAASLSGSKNSSHLFHWEHFWVNRVLSIPSA